VGVFEAMLFGVVPAWVVAVAMVVVVLLVIAGLAYVVLSERPESR
jgi:hypothetical protein